MTCGQTHFEPISSKDNPNWPDPPLDREAREKADRRRRHPNWGGKRPGSGAPKGNLNAWRHGRKSRYSLQLAEFLDQIPAVHDAMLKVNKRRKTREAQAQSAAADLMAEICRRIGEAFLNPANNHLENNQEFLAALHTAQALFKNFSDQQSSEATK